MPVRDTPWRDSHPTRWSNPDAHRWIKPDAASFLKPGVAIATIFPTVEAKYAPNQPRVPSGNSRGGQWTRDRAREEHLTPIGTTFGFVDGLGNFLSDVPSTGSNLASDSEGTAASPLDSFASGEESIGGARSEDRQFDIAARRRGNEAECDFQYKQDSNICRIVGTPACWAQAMERLAACRGGRPIPPLRF